jgi:hypothetical protein
MEEAGSAEHTYRDLAAAASQENTGFERSEAAGEGVSDETLTS